MHQDEDPAGKKRWQARERKARWLRKQKQESLKRIREAKAASLFLALSLFQFRPAGDERF